MDMYEKEIHSQTQHKRNNLKLRLVQTLKNTWKNQLPPKHKITAKEILLK